jgi:hypothetical protein
MLRRASSTAEAEGVGYRDGLKHRLRSAAELARHGTPLPASTVGVERGRSITTARPGAAIR